MQGYSEQNQERTYAAHIAEQQAQAAPSRQHVVVNEQPDERMTQIYNYMTQVADRTRDARAYEVNEQTQVAA